MAMNGAPAVGDVYEALTGAYEPGWSYLCGGAHRKAIWSFRCAPLWPSAEWNPTHPAMKPRDGWGTRSAVTQRLNPELQIAAPGYRVAFGHVSTAIEEHIVGGLFRGKRSRNDDGVFFEKKKLALRGEQAAIQERQRRASPGTVKQLLEVAELIRNRNRGATG